MIKHEKNDKGDVKETLSHSILESTQPSAVDAMVEESQHFMNEDAMLDSVSEETSEVMYLLVDSDKDFSIQEFVTPRVQDTYKFEKDLVRQFLENVLEYGYEVSSDTQKGYIVCLAPVKKDFNNKNLVVIVAKEGRYFASGVTYLKDITFSSILNTKEPILLERIDFSGKVRTWFEVKLQP